MNKIKVKEITEGAIFIAIYGLLTLLIRFIFVSYDSVIYYIFPLPIAIFTIRQKWTLSLAVMLASIGLSFFIYPAYQYTLGLIAPNIFAGFVFGLFEKKTTLRGLNFAITFILLFGANVLSIELFTNGTYFEETLDLVVNVLSKVITVDMSVFTKIARFVEIFVLIFDSIVRLILLIFVFNLLVSRLKLKEGYESKIKLGIKYHFLISLGYIALYAVVSVLGSLMINKDELIIDIIFMLFFVIFFIYGIYIIYQTIFMIRIETINKGPVLFILLSILSFILFPISILIGLFLNIINYNYVLRSIK